jgi:toxin-antitoxin system PIN domain toxin
LIDINVWLALTWDQHPQHSPAAAWFKSLEDAGLLFCRFTMLGLLRLLTNQQVMGDNTLNLSEALDVYDRWRRDPRVEFAAEPRGTEDRFRAALIPHAAAPATKAIADCYLIGFAEAAAAHLVTFDKAFAAGAKQRTVPVVHLRPTGRVGRDRH